jgi:hypothetical protein
MTALQVSISAGDLVARMKQRLSGLAPNPAARIVWEDAGQRVLLHLDSLRARIVDGWLLCQLDLETDQTQRQALQFVYYLGVAGEGGGVQAASTINAASVPASQLADRWGAQVQRLLWDAVLDGIETSIRHVKEQQPGQRVQLRGFTGATNSLNVSVLAGNA